MTPCVLNCIDGVDMGSQVVSAVSLAVAVGAVWVAIWQVRANVRQTERINTLPVLYSAFAEHRSPQFRAQLENVLKNLPESQPAVAFSSLPKDWSDSALAVCYLYDYVGALVAHRLVDEKLIIGVLATQAMQVWVSVEPFVLAEREYRRTNYSQHASPGFLQYYEHLICRIIELGGRDAPALIRAQSGVLCLDAPLNRPIASKTE
jgi:hypothetical protein